MSTAWALPRVRAAVPARTFRCLVDGGIRRGTDVFKALALGANAVLVGRPQVHALACDGALGVARMIRLLRDEFAATLASVRLCLHPQISTSSHLVHSSPLTISTHDVTLPSFRRTLSHLRRRRVLTAIVALAPG